MLKTRAQGWGAIDRIREDGGEAKRLNNPHKSCRRDVGNGGGNMKKCRQESVGSVAADPDNLDNSMEAGREAQGTQGLSKNCSSKESVYPSLRLNRGFIVSIIDPLSGGPIRVA